MFAQCVGIFIIARDYVCGVISRASLPKMLPGQAERNRRRTTHADGLTESLSHPAEAFCLQRQHQGIGGSSFSFFRSPRSILKHHVSTYSPVIDAPSQPRPFMPHSNPSTPKPPKHLDPNRCAPRRNTVLPPAHGFPETSVPTACFCPALRGLVPAL